MARSPDTLYPQQTSQHGPGCVFGHGQQGLLVHASTHTLLPHASTHTLLPHASTHTLLPHASSATAWRAAATTCNVASRPDSSACQVCVCVCVCVRVPGVACCDRDWSGVWSGLTAAVHTRTPARLSHQAQLAWLPGQHQCKRPGMHVTRLHLHGMCGTQLPCASLLLGMRDMCLCARRPGEQLVKRETTMRTPVCVCVRLLCFPG